MLVGFLAVGLQRDPREVPSPLIDKPAPAFNVAAAGAADKQFSPADMKGKVWMLNVWASWCVSCREEHPLLVDLQRQQVVPLIGLDYKDKRPDALKFAGAARQPLRPGGVRRRRPRRHRLRRLWRARDLRHRQDGRHPLQADRPVTPEALQQTILPLVEELKKES